MFYRFASFLGVLMLVILLSSCSFFESSYVKRERFVEKAPIAISVNFVDHSAERVYCSTKAIFELNPDGSGLVQWFGDTGLVGDHGCVFDLNNPIKTEKFRLSSRENIIVRHKLAKIDWSKATRRRYIMGLSNVCGRSTNEEAGVYLVIGDDLSSHYPYDIHPKWVDSRYQTDECIRNTAYEVKIIEDVISGFPISLSANLVLK